MNPEALPTSLNDNARGHHSSSILYDDPVQRISQGSLFSTPAAARRDYQNNHTLTGVAFLSALTSRLVPESILLNLNYITMYQWCMLPMQALPNEFTIE